MQTDESFLASIHLVNNYQDKNDYNAVLLDEEKKRIALQMFNRVKLSLNHFMVLYDKNEELVVFVEHKKDGYDLYFVSYENGKKILYSRHEDQPSYSKHPFPKTLPVNFHHYAYYSEAAAQQGTITHHIYNGQIITTSHLSLFDDAGEHLFMHIEMSHLFDDAYFKNISSNLDLVIRYSTERKNLVSAHALSDIDDIKQLTIIHGERAYFSTAKITTVNGNFFYNIALNKEKLLSTLAKNRRQFFVLIVIVTFLVLVCLRLFFSRTLIHPLELLMEQIRKIDRRDYGQCILIQTGDELETISKNINKLDHTVREREGALLESQKKLEHLSLHDPLTNLPNRRLFFSHLEQTIEQAEQDGMRLAVLFLDLDEFKQVNDTLGHNIGDQLLVQISMRLAETTRSAAVLARIGGDEFTLLMEDVQSEDEVRATAEQLLADFKAPFICDGHDLNVTASIGIAFYPEDGADTVTLIKHADMAMYQAKEEGGDSYGFFSNALEIRMRNRTERINALKKAVLDLDEFYLLYQPKISLLTGRAESMEALIRWQSGILGFMRPDQFIRLAEETNLIIPLGRWIIERALKDFMALQKKGCQLNTVSINISSVQLLNSDMVKTVKRAIRDTGILPEQIELEITESYIATNGKKAVKTLKCFREMGIALAIDDFGTGYSSMSYLRKLPVTRLKIDKSFVDDLSTSEESRAVIYAIIALAKTFKLALTAEGVETQEQLDFLQQAGCDEIQGYFYAKPLTLKDIETFFRTFDASRTLALRKRHKVS